MSRKSEIESLVYLLDDPDPTVQEAVKKRLFELGEQAVPLLDQQRNSIKDDSERALINDIIRSITVGSVEEDFVGLLENGLANMKQLEDAVFMLSRFDTPTLRVLEYKRKLDHFADSIYAKIRYEPDANKQMHGLLNYVFEELEFSGATADYYHPDNAYLDRVIDRRRGLPISLAFIVLFLARRLELPFHGINMPIHFMLMFQSPKEEIFIDPFDHGKTVSYDQCHYFLTQNGIEPESTHFNKIGPTRMLGRCIRNLINSYKRNKNEQKARELKKLLYTLETMRL